MSEGERSGQEAQTAFFDHQAEPRKSKPTTVSPSILAKPVPRSPDRCDYDTELSIQSPFLATPAELKEPTNQRARKEGVADRVELACKDASKAPLDEGKAVFRFMKLPVPGP